MSPQDIFTITVVIFTVTNIGALSLQMNLREALKALYSFRANGLILLWGRIVGPALAFLLWQWKDSLAADCRYGGGMSVRPTSRKRG